MVVFPSGKNASSDVQQSSSSSSPVSNSSKKKFSFGRKITKKGVIEDNIDDIDDQATAPTVNISYVHEPYIVKQIVDPVQPAHNTEEKEQISDSATGGRDDCCSTPLDTFYEMIFGEGEGVNIIECSVDDNVDIIECTNTGCSPTSFGTVATTSCSPWSSTSSWNPNFFQEEETSPDPEGTGNSGQPILRLRCQ